VHLRAYLAALRYSQLDDHPTALPTPLAVEKAQMTDVIQLRIRHSLHSNTSSTAKVGYPPETEDIHSQSSEGLS